MPTDAYGLPLLSKEVGNRWADFATVMIRDNDARRRYGYVGSLSETIPSDLLATSICQARAPCGRARVKGQIASLSLYNAMQEQASHCNLTLPRIERDVINTISGYSDMQPDEAGKKLRSLRENVKEKNPGVLEYIIQVAEALPNEDERGAAFVLSFEVYEALRLQSERDRSQKIRTF